MTYMSLQEATKFCDYTQEYLSLRARQGKLQAVKVGRNWATTKKWLYEYIEKAGEYKGNYSNGSASHKGIAPPLNLPLHAPDADAWEEATPAEIARRFAFWQNVKFAFAAAVVVVLLVAGLAQERQAVLRVADEMAPAVFAAVQHLQESAQEAGVSAGANVVHWGEAGIGELFGEYFTWLWPFDNAAERLVEPTPASLSAPRTPGPGMVVVPSSPNNEQVKEQIRQSFSDEVLVTPHDKESGIITPVFRDRKGEDYLYILVPLLERE